MKISKWKMAIGIVAAIALTATSAYATSLFDDVDDGRFFSAPAEWASNNGITNGCGGGNFCPNDPVTRGENITFAFRYDDQIVQPALEEIESNVATIASDVNNATRVHFARVASDGDVEKTSNQSMSVTRVSEGVYDVTLPEDPENCAVTTALHHVYEGGFGGLNNLLYQNEAFIWSDRDNTDDDNDVRVFVVDADDGATTDGDTLPDFIDLDFSITATCSDPVFIFDPGIVINPIITLDD
ncbi:MAG: S-layer homology domain-containing protein [Actinomycetota bacterium]